MGALLTPAFGTVVLGVHRIPCGADVCFVDLLGGLFCSALSDREETIAGALERSQESAPGNGGLGCEQ